MIRMMNKRRVSSKARRFPSLTSGLVLVQEGYRYKGNYRHAALAPINPDLAALADDYTVSTGGGGGIVTAPVVSAPVITYPTYVAPSGVLADPVKDGSYIEVKVTEPAVPVIVTPVAANPAPSSLVPPAAPSDEMLYPNQQPIATEASSSTNIIDSLISGVTSLFTSDTTSSSESATAGSFETGAIVDGDSSINSGITGGGGGGGGAAEPEQATADASLAGDKRSMYLALIVAGAGVLALLFNKK